MRQSERGLEPARGLLGRRQSAFPAARTCKREPRLNYITLQTHYPRLMVKVMVRRITLQTRAAVD
jgi:hypothetical protein